MGESNLGPSCDETKVPGRNQFPQTVLGGGKREGSSVMAKTLAQFSITRTGDGDYMLHLEDEDGETVEYAATFDQLDLISEAIEEQLDDDEDEVLGVDEDDDREDDDE